jgi:diguanylate cyclase (GGDEF)-like protein
LVRDPAAARAKAERALAAARGAGYATGQALARINLGWLAFFGSDLRLAQTEAAAALEGFTAADDLLGAALAFNLLGAADHERGDFERALDRYTKAIELAQTAGRTDRAAAPLNNVGEVLADTGNHSQAMEYFKRAEAAVREGSADGLRAEELKATIDANIGQCAIALGDTEKAAGYLESALAAAVASGDAAAETRALKSLAVVARRSGEKRRARALLERALERAAVGRQVPAEVEAKIELAVLLSEEDEFAAARAVLDEAAAASAAIGSGRRLADCLRLRSAAAEALGEYQAALYDFKRFREAEASLAADRIAQGVRDAETRFDLEKARQDAEIYRLRNVELKNQRAEAERTANRLKVVSEMGRVITASLDMDEVVRSAQRGLSGLMDVTGFTLVLYDEQLKRLEFQQIEVSGERLPPLTVPADSPDSFAAWVVAHRQPLRLDNADLEYSRYIGSPKLAFSLHTVSVIYAPILFGDKVVGAVGVQSPRPSAYDDEDVRLILSLGAFIAVAVENSRTHAELRRVYGDLRKEKDALEQLSQKMSRIANHDGLTELPNRLLLGEILETQLAQAVRSGKPLAVLFLDLDDFKPINDRFGHQTGDIALTEAAARLKRGLRSSDVVARVGGDEFIAVLPEAGDAASVALVAEKLGEAIAEPLSLNGESCRIGVSIGIAVFPKDAGTVDELIRCADSAMYRAKRSGKRRYAFWEAPRE